MTSARTRARRGVIADDFRGRPGGPLRVRVSLLRADDSVPETKSAAPDRTEATRNSRAYVSRRDYGAALPQRLRAVGSGDSFSAVHRRARERDDAGTFRKVPNAGGSRESQAERRRND